MRSMGRRHSLEEARRGDICVKYTSKAGVINFIAMASEHT